MSLNQDQSVCGPIDPEEGTRLGVELHRLSPLSSSLQNYPRLPDIGDYELSWAGEVNYRQETFDLIPPGLTKNQLQSIVGLYPWVGRATLAAIPVPGLYQFM